MDGSTPRKVAQATEMTTRLAEGERNVWIHNAEFGVTIEDVLQPSHWAHVAAKFTHYDRIEVRAADNTWLAELVVRDRERNWARVKLLAKYDLTDSDASQAAVPADEFEIVWKNAQLKYCVIRKSDGAVMAKEHREKRSAQEWLRGYQLTISAP